MSKFQKGILFGLFSLGGVFQIDYKQIVPNAISMLALSYRLNNLMKSDSTNQMQHSLLSFKFISSIWFSFCIIFHMDD